MAAADCSSICDTQKYGPECCYDYLCQGLEGWTETNLSACQEEIGNPQTANECNTSTFQFFYSVCEAKMNPSRGSCMFRYNYQPYQCSATDTCNTSQAPKYLYPASCDASSYNASIGPTSACTTNATVYKACCDTSTGMLDGDCTGGDHSGSCPAGAATVRCGMTLEYCVDRCGSDNCYESAARSYCTTTLCNSNPCAFLKPDCNGDKICYGDCTYEPGLDNTCSSANGTYQDGCEWTTYNNSSNCNKVSAPNSCDKSCPLSLPNCNASSQCVADTPIVRPVSPSPSPSPSATVTTASCSITANCNNSPICSFVARYTLNGQIQTNYRARVKLDNNNSGSWTSWENNNNLPSHTYIPGDYNITLEAKGLDDSNPTSCLGTASPVYSSTWSRQCTIADGQTSFTITAPPNAPTSDTWATYNGGQCPGQGCVWQGTISPGGSFNHVVNSGQNFTWYIDPQNDSPAISGNSTCYQSPTSQSGSAPVSAPSLGNAQFGLYSKFQYNDGSPYDGSGLLVEYPANSGKAVAYYGDPNAGLYKPMLPIYVKLVDSSNDCLDSMLTAQYQIAGRGGGDSSVGHFGFNGTDVTSQSGSANALLFGKSLQDTKRGYHYSQIIWNGNTGNQDNILRMSWPLFPNTFRVTSNRMDDSLIDSIPVADTCSNQCNFLHNGAGNNWRYRDYVGANQNWYTDKDIIEDGIAGRREGIPVGDTWLSMETVPATWRYNIFGTDMCSKGFSPTFIFTIQAPMHIKIRKEGGSGTITSNPESTMDCPANVKDDTGDCKTFYKSSAYINASSNQVSLIATPDSNSIFDHWTGCDSTMDNICTVSVFKSREVTAVFNPKPRCSYLKTTGGDVYSGAGINMSCSR